MTPQEKHAKRVAAIAILDERIDELVDAIAAIEEAIFEDTANALGRARDELDFSLEWGCPPSPNDTCAYDPEEDPANDSCLFCHQPAERK